MIDDSDYDDNERKEAQHLRDFREDGSMSPAAEADYLRACRSMIAMRIGDIQRVLGARFATEGNTDAACRLEDEIRRWTAVENTIDTICGNYPLGGS